MQYRCTSNGGIGVTFVCHPNQSVPDGFIEKVGSDYPKIGQEFNSAQITVNGGVFMVLDVKVFKPAILVYKFEDEAVLHEKNVAKGKLYGALECPSVTSLAMRAYGYFGFINANTGEWMARKIEV